MSQDISCKIRYTGLMNREKFVIVYWQTCPFSMVPMISYYSQVAQIPPAEISLDPRQHPFLHMLTSVIPLFFNLFIKKEICIKCPLCARH